MEKSKYFIVAIYTLFTILVNVKPLYACEDRVALNHSCCCTASTSSCQHDNKDCCVDEDENNGPFYDHFASSEIHLEAPQFFVAESSQPLAVHDFENSAIKLFINKAPPPKVKVYITIHQLILYA